jgi:hypothetical protein
MKNLVLLIFFVLNLSFFQYSELLAESRRIYMEKIKDWDYSQVQRIELGYWIRTDDNYRALENIPYLNYINYDIFEYHHYYCTNKDYFVYLSLLAYPDWEKDRVNNECKKPRKAEEIAQLIDKLSQIYKDNFLFAYEILTEDQQSKKNPLLINYEDEMKTSFAKWSNSIYGFKKFYQINQLRDSYTKFKKFFVQDYSTNDRKMMFNSLIPEVVDFRSLVRRTHTPFRIHYADGVSIIDRVTTGIMDLEAIPEDKKAQLDYARSCFKSWPEDKQAYIPMENFLQFYLDYDPELLIKLNQTQMSPVVSEKLDKFIRTVYDSPLFYARLEHLAETCEKVELDELEFILSPNPGKK